MTPCRNPWCAEAAAQRDEATAQAFALKAEVAYLRAMRVWTKNYESMMRLYNVGAANPTAWRAANPQPVKPEGVDP